MGTAAATSIAVTEQNGHRRTHEARASRSGVVDATADRGLRLFVIRELHFCIRSSRDPFITVSDRENSDTKTSCSRLYGREALEGAPAARSAEALEVLRAAGPPRADQLVPRARLDEVDFMSIDVEGAELSLLRSVNWRRVRVRIMVVERPSVEVRQLLRDEANPFEAASSLKVQVDTDRAPKLGACEPIVRR